ncbi:MAG: NADH:flavin oxidoreductase [Caldilineae bacterium]|nr:MAG: NADH:flavin oxidoreductase [Caldilineae bacterium]
MTDAYPRIARLRTPELFRGRIEELGINLPFDEQVIPAPDGPLAQPYVLKNGRVIGNRFAVHPMEGWDGTPDGLPTDFTRRRWRNFGRSGGKLIWGGEAVAVRHDGRANPNQLMICERNLSGFADLRRTLVDAHRQAHGRTDDLLVGLQLTHSGRFARPNVKTRLEPKILYHHPVLDRLFAIDPDLPVLTDGEIDDLIGDFVRAAAQAASVGFDFVDIKHCHGYLGHEFLSAYTRPGRYGGSFENRTRFLREVVAGIRRDVPDLMIGVRVSAFDFPPFRPGPDGRGVPQWLNDQEGLYPFGFGADHDDPFRVAIDEILEFLQLLRDLDIELVNLSCCSPYYNPHFMRPAYFPPSDGYLPPEDPLVGVARQINVVAALKQRMPDLAMVGTGYSYLQEWLPNVAQYVVRTGMVDFVGLGRMILSYPEMPADVLAGRELDRKHICRTFSDCTTAPRNGLISGCYPLDEFYKSLPEAIQLREIKKKPA